MGRLPIGTGAALRAGLLGETGFRTGMNTGGGVGAGLLVEEDPPNPGGIRQFGAVGCKHCLLLQIAPGSQQSDAELQLLP